MGAFPGLRRYKRGITTMSWLKGYDCRNISMRLPFILHGLASNLFWSGEQLKQAIVTASDNAAVPLEQIKVHKISHWVEDILEFGSVDTCVG